MDLTHAADRMTVKLLANGSRASHTYDAADRLTRLANLKDDATTISSFDYTYDCTANRRCVIEADGTIVSWTYDKKYQLTGERRGGLLDFGWSDMTANQWADMTVNQWSELELEGSVTGYNATFTYDPVGNRLVHNDSGVRTTYAYDAANELLTETALTGTTTYSYDDCGNRTEKEAPLTTTFYSWDEQQRMITAEPPAGAVTLTYNAAGKRVEKETPTEARKFIYDFEKVLQETDDADVTQMEYTSTLREFGNLLSQFDGTDSEYPASDALGSTANLLNAAQTSDADWVYRAFGQVESKTGLGETDFTFVGQKGYFADLETDLYFLNERYEDPLTGRMLSEDRLGYRTGEVNMYLYADNNPVNKIDPSGRQPITADELLGKIREAGVEPQQDFVDRVRSCPSEKTNPNPTISKPDTTKLRR